MNSNFIRVLLRVQKNYFLGWSLAKQSSFFEYNFEFAVLPKRVSNSRGLSRVIAPGQHSSLFRNGAAVAGR